MHHLQFIVTIAMIVTSNILITMAITEALNDCEMLPTDCRKRTPGRARHSTLLLLLVLDSTLLQSILFALPVRLISFYLWLGFILGLPTFSLRIQS